MLQSFPYYRRHLWLLQMIDFRDVLGRVGELESDSFAMPACREAPAFMTVTSRGISACSGSCVIA
jgi:hypothetical protein